MTQNYDIKGRTALVFAPFAAIARHARLESKLEVLLAGFYDEVLHVSCAGILDSRCTTMFAFGKGEDISKFEKRALCNFCMKCSSVISQQSDTRLVRLDDVVQAEDLSEWGDLRDAWSSRSWREFTYADIPIGRYCSYEMILLAKDVQFERSPKFRDAYQGLVKSGFLALKAAQRLADVHAPELVAVHSFQYGINRCFLAGFNDTKSQKISFTNAGAFSQWDEFFSVSETAFFSFPAKEVSPSAYVDIPLSEHEYDTVDSHLVASTKSTNPWVYSSKRLGLGEEEVRNTLRLRATSKICVALVSSPDELLAAQEALLIRRSDLTTNSDADFLRLVVETARQMPEIDFVVRVHPRLYRTLREPYLSPFLGEMDGIFLDSPSNIRINTPESSLSLYDLASVTDCVLNHRSTAGLEFICLGIPVILPFPDALTSYPTMLNQGLRGGATSLVAQITEVLDGKWLDKSDQAFRWLGYSLNRRLLRLHTEVSSLSASDFLEGEKGKQERLSLEWRKSLKRLFPRQLRFVLGLRKAALSLDASWLTRWKSDQVSLGVERNRLRDELSGNLTLSQQGRDRQSDRHLLDALLARIRGRETAG